MLNKKQWETREKELVELKQKREEMKERKESVKEISKKIHYLQNAMNQHEKHKEQKVRTDTACYKMFGKPLKELTKEEYNLYQRRTERRKRKQLRQVF